MQAQRRRYPLDIPGAPCQLCSAATVVIETRAVRSALSWLSPRWDPDVRIHAVCQDCGAKHTLREAGAA